MLVENPDRKSTEPSKIGNLVESILAKNPLFSANPVGDWSEIVGRQVAKYSQPVKYKNGKLTVHVFDSVWKHHLELSKDELISKINSLHNRQIVKDISFKVGELKNTEDIIINPVASYRTGKKGSPRASRRKRKGKPLKYPLSEESKKFIKTIKDPELKAIARRLLPLFPPE